MATTGAAAFNGTDTYLTRGADFTGIADSAAGTIMAFFKRADALGNLYRIFHNTGGNLRLELASTTKVYLRADSVSATVLELFSTGTYVDTTSWHVILCSWNLVATPVAHMYIDDTDDEDTGATNINTATVDYTVADHAVGGSTAGGQPFNGALGPIWLAPGFYIDLDVAANRRKFHTGDAVPKLAAALDASASSPGAAPILWLKNEFSTYQNNLGSGGGMTEQGTLASATGPEIEALSGAFNPALFHQMQRRSQRLRM